MSPERKLALRRWALRQLRQLLDFADDRLHAAEVRLREELACRPAGVPERIRVYADPPARVGSALPRRRETFIEWEARRSGVAPIRKPARRRQRVTAADFDLRFEARARG